MKPLLLLIVPMLLNASSCKKNKETSQPPASNTVVGKWKLVLITGGIGGIHMTADECGHSKSMLLNTDETYSFIEDGKVNKGKYKTGTDKVGNNTIDIIAFNGTDNMQYTWTHDTLVLNMYNMSDVMFDWYVRE